MNESQVQWIVDELKYWRENMTNKKDFECLQARVNTGECVKINRNNILSVAEEAREKSTVKNILYAIFIFVSGIIGAFSKTIIKMIVG